MGTGLCDFVAPDGPLSIAVKMFRDFSGETDRVRVMQQKKVLRLLTKPHQVLHLPHQRERADVAGLPYVHIEDARNFGRLVLRRKHNDGALVVQILRKRADDLMLVSAITADRD